jgi:class 3 adenylate cyclase/pimeloyl-ACP methyl ester carboxylesterase
VDTPETQYTKTTDGVHIAYQVLGEGPFDFVFVNSTFTSNVEIVWEWHELASSLRWLASRGRLLLFDRRGTGLSDGVSGERLPTLDARMDDIRAVMDAVGLSRAVLFGLEDGAAQCFLFAATYPERTSAIIAFAAASRGTWTPEAPWLWTEAQWAEWFAEIDSGWGTPEFTSKLATTVFPSKVDDPPFLRTWGRAMRHSMSPADALVTQRMHMETDVRHVLPVIQAPTLVVHHTGDLDESVEEGRYIAEHIPGAKLLELEGADHGVWVETLGGASSNVERFLSSFRAEEAEFDRVLATVLFTDVVGSTQKAAELGDRVWKELVERHHSTVRALLGRYRGREVNTAGDGFFATFDGPARAIRCAKAINDALHPIGLEVRSGLHTGEVETINDEVGGIAVNIGARVASKAGPSEVLVSQTVKDLVAGSGLTFEDAGEHELKGVPDRWRLYRVVD